jgi:TRAP-type C4-dicarboxylate transport system permease small subunit
MLPYCQLTRSHVSVDLFTSSLSAVSLARLQRFSDLLMAIAATFFAVMLARGMLSYQADGVRSPVLDWHVWPFMIPGIAAVGLWALFAVRMALNPSRFDQQSSRDGTH